MRVYSGLAFALFLASACGNNDFGEPPPPTETEGGSTLPPGPDGGNLSNHDAGCLQGLGDLGCLENDDDGPIIMFVSPAMGALATGSSLKVQVTVMLRPGQKGGIDTVNVFIPGTKVSSVMGSNGVPFEFEGSLDISAATTGDLTIAVTARAQPSGRVATALLTVLRDAGPQIIVYRPQNTTYAHSTSVLFSVINPTGLAKFDVDWMNGTQAVIEQVPIQLTLTGMDPPTWSGTIDFHDKAFTPALASGPQTLHLSAHNAQHTETIVDVPFTIDEQGPSIKIITPTPGEVVGGPISIEAQIDDPSDVTKGSVFAVIAHTYHVPLTRAASSGGMSDIYVGTIDARQVAPAVVFLAISVVATDLLGNQGSTPEEVALDIVPPGISLDPPPYHVVRMSDYVCSDPFDPVGDEAIDDGDIARQLDWFRARIEDFTNRGLQLDGTPGVGILAGVDPTTVTLYLALGGQPLIVDSDGDGFCDEINPDLVPTSMLALAGEALALPLTPLPVEGTPDYEYDGFDSACVYDGNPQGIVGSKTETTAPKPLCEPIATKYPFPMTYHLRYTVQDMPASAIWSIPPNANPPSILCNGLEADLANRVVDGPLCAAVQASDLVGNRNVSPALRLCVDKFGANTCGAPYAIHGTPRAGALPDCTGSIVNGKVTAATPCTPGVRLNNVIPTQIDPFPPHENPRLVP